MREIKFRVWDKSLREHRDIFLQYTSYRCGFILDHAGEVDEEDLVWEQYTGINDKDGEEVCEGDYIRGYGCVEYRNGAFHVINRSGQTVDYLFNFDVSHIKIIGNIHENKELLNA